MKAPAAAISLVLWLHVSAGAQSTSREPGPSDQAAERAAESLRLANEEVKRFEFFFADDPGRTLQLRPAPVHRHATYHAEAYSNLFIWTAEGRPEAIASVTNWYSPRPYRGLAVTSLSTEKLIGTRDGREIWHPQQAGVVFHPVPGAEAPSETAVLRLREMRSLAREFTAEFKRVARYPEGGKLRLLSTPLFRYGRPDSPLLDGAIFGFAFGTAPQLLLLIEARKAVSGFRWEYAVAPRNSTEYHVWHGDREVWSLAQLAPPWPNSKIPTNTYTVFPDLQREGRTEEFAEQLLHAIRTSQVR